MSTQHIIGDTKPVETSCVRTTAEKNAYVAVVEGPWYLVEALNPTDYCPGGYEVERSEVSSEQDGFARLTVRCIEYSGGSSWNAERTTFRIEMAETTYDLVDHPKITASTEAVKEATSWLATDESKRVQASGANIVYKYSDATGTLHDVTTAFGIKFCAAYMAGIKTFNRYYPVIEKIGVWKNPPGLNRTGTSFSDGSPTFSANIGTYNSPPLTLNGYPSINWFKSKDSWVENGDKTWTRTEQWTYTPESSSGTHAWIYTP